MFDVFAYNAIYALSAPLNKTIAVIAPPLIIVAIRQLVAGALLSSYHVISARNRPSLSLHEASLLLQMAAFTMLIPPLLRTYALQSVSSIKLTLLYSLSPFPTYLLSHFFIGESISKKKTLGILVGCLGLFLVLVDQPGVQLSYTSWQFSMGELLILLAVLSDSYGSVVTSRLVKNTPHSTLFINGATMLMAGGVALGACMYTGVLVPPAQLYPVMGTLAVIIFTSNILSYNFYGVLLRRYSVTFLSLCDFTRTAFAIVYGNIFLKESFPPSFFIATTIIFLGLYIFYREDKNLS